MNCKIIGFLISPEEVNFEFDFFRVGLSCIKFENNIFHIYLWGIGDLENCKINDNYTLSFPKNENLLDRNVLIKIFDNQIIVENDWLGSIPIFYNQKELVVSTISNLCLKDKTFDIEGLLNYFDFGYSVFEHTSFEDVKFLRYYSTVLINKDKIEIRHKDDPILEIGLFNKTTTALEAIDSIKDYISSIEKNISGEIIIPTSGGFDSRLLNWAITDKSRVRSFTYGISKDQSKSREVIFAKELSKLLNTKWEQIELSQFHDYIDEWFKIFGFSTHLHGMYQIEFYKKISSLKNFSLESTLLSGIIGDAWAGSIKKFKISNAIDVKKLGYSHNLNLSNSFFQIGSNNKYITNFFERNKSSFETPQIQVVGMMRLKLILLSYLATIPEYFSLPVWTPFLNFKNAVMMLQLPDEIRNNRNWQRNFFNSVGLDLENMNLAISNRNSLNFEIAKKFKFESINEKYFRNVVKPKKIIRLNRKINVKLQDEIIEYLLLKFRINGMLKIIGVEKVGYLKHLSNYYVLKAVEKSIK